MEPNKDEIWADVHLGIKSQGGQHYVGKLQRNVDSKSRAAMGTISAPSEYPTCSSSTASQASRRLNMTTLYFTKCV